MMDARRASANLLGTVRGADYPHQPLSNAWYYEVCFTWNPRSQDISRAKRAHLPRRAGVGHYRSE